MTGALNIIQQHGLDLQRRRIWVGEKHVKTQVEVIG